MLYYEANEYSLHLYQTYYHFKQKFNFQKKLYFDFLFTQTTYSIILLKILMNVIFERKRYILMFLTITTYNSQRKTKTTTDD